MSRSRALGAGVLVGLVPGLVHCVSPAEPALELRAWGEGGVPSPPPTDGQASLDAACNASLVEAVAAGELPQIEEIEGGIAVFGASPLGCSKLEGTTTIVDGVAMSAGQASCASVESEVGLAPGSLTWETWEEGGVLRCGCACGDPLPPIAHRYIWIANSAQGTVSKVDTDTMIEFARYATSPTWADPSRTSVGPSGHAAIANRLGSVVKVYGHPSECPDVNLNGVIDTSTGPTDVRPWGEDECVAWLTEFPQYTSQRPVSWTHDEKIWTSGTGAKGIDVVLLDGETGGVEQIVPIPNVDPAFFGLYGSATDADGNFWASQLGVGWLVRVDRQTFAVETWPMSVSGYGMAVDPDGYVWTCSQQGVGRFTPTTGTWTVAHPNPGGSGGCMADDQGRLWLANDPLVAVDRQTLTIAQVVDLPSYARGIGVDFFGRVWGVGMFNEAHRVDPDSGSIGTVTGFENPYTYSDMTGFALAHAGDTDAPGAGLPCVAGLPCDTGLVGACAPGITQCLGSAQHCATTGVAMADDLCGNGLDDDCNGLVDDC